MLSVDVAALRRPSQLLSSPGQGHHFQHSSTAGHTGPLYTQQVYGSFALPPPDATASSWRQTPAMRMRRTFGAANALVDEASVHIRGAAPSVACVLPDSPIVAIASGTPVSKEAASFTSPTQGAPGSPGVAGAGGQTLPSGIHFVQNFAPERLLDVGEGRDPEQVQNQLKRIYTYQTYSPVYSMDASQSHILAGGSQGKVSLLSYAVDADNSGIFLENAGELQLGLTHEIEQIRPAAPGRMSGSIIVNNVGFLPTAASAIGMRSYQNDPATPLSAGSNQSSLSSLAAEATTHTKMYASVGDKLVLFDINANGNENLGTPSNGYDFSISTEVIRSISAESYVRTSLLALGSSDSSVAIVDTRLCEQASRRSKNVTGGSHTALNVKTSTFSLSSHSSSANFSSGKKPGVVWNVPSAHVGQVETVKFNPFIPYMLATGGSDGVVKVWDIRYFKNPTARIDGHYGAVNDIAWSTAHVEQLATASMDHRWRLWQLSSTSTTSQTPDFDYLVDCPGSDLKSKTFDISTVVGAQLLAESTVSQGSLATSAPLSCTVASKRHMGTFYSCSAYGVVTSHTLRRELYDELIPENYDSIHYPGAHNVETNIYYRSLLDSYDEMFTLVEDARDQGKILAPFEEELFKLCDETAAIDPRSWMIPPATAEMARIGGTTMVKNFRTLLDKYNAILPPGLNQILDVERLIPKKLQRAYDLIKLRFELVSLALKMGRSDNAIFIQQYNIAHHPGDENVESATSGTSKEQKKGYFIQPLDNLYDSLDEISKEMVKSSTFVNSATLGVFARAVMRDNPVKGLRFLYTLFRSVNDTKEREFTDIVPAAAFAFFPTVYETEEEFFITGPLRDTKDSETVKSIDERLSRIILFVKYLEHLGDEIYELNEDEDDDEDGILEETEATGTTTHFANRFVQAVGVATILDIPEVTYSNGVPMIKTISESSENNSSPTKSETSSIEKKHKSIMGSIESLTHFGFGKSNGNSSKRSSGIVEKEEIKMPPGKTHKKTVSSDSTKAVTATVTAKGGAMAKRALFAAIPQSDMNEQSARDAGLYYVIREASDVMPMLQLELKIIKIVGSKGFNEGSAKEIVEAFESEVTLADGKSVKVPILERTISTTTIQLYLESLLMLQKPEQYFAAIFDMATLYNHHAYPLALLDHVQTVGLPHLQLTMNVKLQLATIKIDKLTAELNEIIATGVSGKIGDGIAMKVSDLVRETVRDATQPLQEGLLTLIRIGASLPKATLVSGFIEATSIPGLENPAGINARRETKIRTQSGQVGGAIMSIFEDVRDGLYDLFTTSKKVLALTSGGTFDFNADESSLSDSERRKRKAEMAPNYKINLGNKFGATGAMALCERVIGVQTAVKSAAMVFAQRRTFGMHTNVMAVGGNTANSPQGAGRGQDDSRVSKNGYLLNVAGDMAAETSKLLGALDKCMASLSGP